MTPPNRRKDEQLLSQQPRNNNTDLLDSPSAMILKGLASGAGEQRDFGSAAHNLSRSELERKLMTPSMP